MKPEAVLQDFSANPDKAIGVRADTALKMVNSLASACEVIEYFYTIGTDGDFDLAVDKLYKDLKWLGIEFGFDEEA